MKKKLFFFVKGQRFYRLVVILVGSGEEEKRVDAEDL